MIYLRQSTASQEIPLGRFVDSTDGNTEETALSIANTDIKIWKTGATTLASKNSGGATHIANGEYYCVLDATDTDTIGPMKVTVHVSGALYVQVFCTVLDEAVYDVLFGTTALSTLGGTAQTGDAYAIVNSGTHGNAALKTLIDAVDNFVDTEITDIQNRLPAALVGGRIDASVGAMAANVLTAAATAADFGTEIADAIWDEVMEGTRTARQFMRGWASALLGKLSGGGTATEVFRDIDDTKDRITATVDASGNRSAITLDLT